MKNNKGDKLELLRGKLIAIPFVNKGGKRIEGAESLFLEINQERFFVKFTAESVTKEALTPHLNAFVQVQGNRDYGQWDSDDPTVQSRIGAYVVIFEVLPSV